MLPLSRSEGLAFAPISLIIFVVLKRFAISLEENWSRDKISLPLNFPFMGSIELSIKKSFGKPRDKPDSPLGLSTRSGS